MKYKVFVFAAVVFALFSCSVKQIDSPDPEGTEITIRAFHEGAPETRTTLIDGGTLVYWEPSDEINLFFRGSGSRFISQNTENVQSADFTGSLNIVAGHIEGTSGSNTLWGLYPYRADATSDGESVITTLPAKQTGRAGTFAKNTHITLAKSNSFDLAFYNVCSGVRFSLTQKWIKRVTFEGNNGEALAGKIKLVFENGIPTVKEISDTCKMITLSAPNGETFQTGQWYYIEALPGALSGGWKMTFYTGTRYAERTSSSAVSFRRGTFGSLSGADRDLVFQPFFNAEPVDLGLSVKWASFNLGAFAPEEYGDYYAWGENEPKEEYSWANYKWCNEDYNKLTKYCPSSKTDYWDGTGTPDGKTILDLEDDAARANWGETWRMPTNAEWTELINNCTWTWTNQNSVNGYLVTASNGNSIFLPAAGGRYGTRFLYAGSEGYYWSSSLYTVYPPRAWVLDCLSRVVNNDSLGRCNGFPIRPVCQ